MKRSSLGAQLRLFVVLTIGAALAWGLAGAFVDSMWETHMSGAGRGALVESLLVDLEGRPLVSSYTNASGLYRQLPYRTLDGAKVDADNVDELTGASLPEAPKKRRWFDPPRTWVDRLNWMYDGRRDSTEWLLIRDATDQGRTYLAGYDQGTRLCIGYIGRGDSDHDGFRGDIPPRDKQFDLGPESLNFGGRARIAGHGLNGAYRQQEFGPDMPIWQVFLVDGEALVKVDVRERAVHTILKSPGIISISMLDRPAPKSDGGGKGSPKRAERLAVRFEDRIEVLNPAGDQRTTFPLPENLRAAKGLSVYQLSEDQLLLYPWLPPERGYELTWLDSQGKVVKQQTLHLATYAPPSERSRVLTVTAVMPIPVAFATMFSTLIPIDKVLSNQASDYPTALAEAWHVAWPAFVTLLVVCAGLAWMVVRRQRQDSLPHTGVWAVAVFLTGVPGLFAYWLEHRRELKATCSLCNKVVPRTRDACPACGGEFAEPRLVGTEVFA